MMRTGNNAPEANNNIGGGISPDNGKISMRQTMIMYIVACLSPATRVFPIMGSKYGRHAGWVAVLVGAAALAALSYVFASFFKKGESGPRCLSDVFERVFGKLGGKTVIAAYFLWAALLYTFYIRYYAERMLATIFITADMRFFLLTMMALVFVAVRGRLEVFARFSEISVLLFTVIMLALAICLMPTFEIQNVWPVTYLDAVPILKATFTMLGTFGYLTFFFFLGEQISNKRDAGRLGRKGALYLGLMLTLVTVICIGTLSYRVAANMPTPFFSTTKLITIMQPLDRLEALLLSEWVISDFIIITAFAFILMNIGKKLFNLKHARYLATPVAFFGFVGGILIASSRFELEAFSDSTLAVAINTAMSFGAPVLTLIIGKLRRVI
ncbi:MAG: spore germination protein [Oscillospiraceae bacterium]|jgi:spore germination protein (amino acid permease)|nr:spore germination protein [Oscillospiraceae bacterium]